MKNVHKGIIMAGGRGSRLLPLTHITSKHLLPVYDKPLIYYSLSTLLLAGIREVMIICNEEHLDQFRMLLGDGGWLGISITYRVQTAPRGIAEVFELASDFIANANFMLALGDNIFWGSGLVNYLNNMTRFNGGARTFACKVSDPERFGVLSLDGDKVISIEEKPLKPKSNWACAGLYVFDDTVLKRAEKLEPSARGELEISDVLASYVAGGKLFAQRLGRGYFWLDAGTVESFHQASEFVAIVEEKQKVKIACLEEIAYNNRWIGKSDITALERLDLDNPYYSYLRNIIDQ